MTSGQTTKREQMGMAHLAEEYLAGDRDRPFYHLVAKAFGLGGADATQKCWDNGLDHMTAEDKRG